MYVKGPITHIVKDCPSYPDLTTIDLSNKRVISLQQTLPSIIQNSSTNDSSSSRFGQSKIQILANDNQLTNLKGIEIVSHKLASIKAHNNRIKNLQGIQNLQFPYIQKLYLQYNQITDLSGLQTSNFPRLIRLTLNSNRLTSQKLHILTQLNTPQLRILGLDNNNITSIQFIKDIKLINIIDINLSNNQIQDILPLKYCIFIHKLSKIQLQNNCINKVPNINTNLSNLRKLLLSNNKIQTVQGLISCQFPYLQVLQLQNNLLTNIQFMYRFNAPKIVDIKLSKNKIVRVSNKVLRYGCFSVLEQLLLKNNMISGNLIDELMVSFCDVWEIREDFLEEFRQQKRNTTIINNNTESKNNTMNNTINITNSIQNVNNNKNIIKTVLQKKPSLTPNSNSNSTNIQNYNDNKTFSMFSCWRNKLIIKKQQQVYTKLKHHFDKLSYLEF